MGDRNFEESERKGNATRAGLERRKAKGKPVGPLPHGYTVEKGVVDDEVVTRRVVDGAFAPVVLRLFSLVGDGHTSGETARAANAAGHRTKRGRDWDADAVADLIRNDVYRGERGYPRLVPDELWHAANAALDARSRASGRHYSGAEPKEPWLLRGLVTCSLCGAPMICARRAYGRVYLCSARKRKTGTCHAQPVRADVLESTVLLRLREFVGNVGDWVRERLADRQKDAVGRRGLVEREREALRVLERQMANFRADASTDDAAVRRAALRELDRLEGEHQDQVTLIEQAEARASEWNVTPDDFDDVERWLNDVLNVVVGKMDRADGTAELAAALRVSVASIGAAIYGYTLKQRQPIGGEMGVHVNLRVPVENVGSYSLFTPADVPQDLGSAPAQQPQLASAPSPGTRT
jgi:hypothetical protein